jgi:hypothetical protein
MSESTPGHSKIDWGANPFEIELETRMSETSSSVALVPLPLPELISTIKTLIEKGDHAFEKGRQFYIAAGMHLKDLKSRKPAGVAWESYVRETCDLGRSRADELIRIADGRTDYNESLVEASVRMRQIRERPSPPECSGGVEVDKPLDSAAEPKRIPWQGDIVKLATSRVSDFAKGYEREMNAKQRREFRANMREKFNDDAYNAIPELRARAKKLGCKLRKRGTGYLLEVAEGAAFSLSSLEQTVLFGVQN